MMQLIYDYAEQFLTAVGRRVPQIVPLLLLLFALSAISIPILQGYMPGDDALRHAGYASQERSWHELVDFREGVYSEMDTHPGWHFWLRMVHQLTGANTEELLLAEMAVAFCAFFLAGTILLRRPEAFLIGLFVFLPLAAGSVVRLMMGRPFIIAMACLLVYLALWSEWRKPSRPWYLPLTLGLLGLVQGWMHSTYYLLALPMGAIVLSATLEHRLPAALRFIGWIAAGVLAGSILTGHPFDFLWWNLLLAYWCLEPSAAPALVGELEAGSVPLNAFVVFLIYLALRPRLLGKRRQRLTHPAFIVAVAGVLLGFLVNRFWVDWGMPALLLFLTLDIQVLLESLHSRKSIGRLLTTAVVAIGFLGYLGTAQPLTNLWQSERYGRWRQIHEDPRFDQFVTGVDGRVYSTDMAFFYYFLYARPEAPWTYNLGFGPALMPDRDRAVLYDLAESGELRAIAPWVQALEADDLLVLSNYHGDPRAKFPQLKWTQLHGVWFARTHDVAEQVKADPELHRSLP